MKIIRDPEKMQLIALRLKKTGKSIGFVPTMGALHDGHVSLIKRARKENDVVIVSIFVNPKQFGPKEDYLRYPRPFSEDLKKCRRFKTDYVFYPEIKLMYPEGYKTFVNVETFSEILCGKFRPGHFRGVATVVTKLFNICQASKAYFGQKDYQQLIIIKKLCKDLNIPVKIIPCNTVREKSGLALSSRNRYLSKSEHIKSAYIYKALQLTRDLIKSRKVKEAGKISKIIHNSIKKIGKTKIDYIEILAADKLEKIKIVKFPILLAVAVWIGKTRLIDNIVVEKRK